MKRSAGLLVFLAALLAGFLGLGLSGGRSAAGGDRRELRIAYPTEPRSLDPVEVDDTFSEGVARRIFNCLVRHGPDLAPAPDLAEGWTVSADGRLVRFALRSGVRFHNGREMTAADAVWSLRRLLAKPIARRLRPLAAVESVGAPDARTVELRLSGPQPLLLDVLAMMPAAVVPPEEVERVGEDFGRRPVGTGPFRLAGWQRGSRLRLERFPEHFRGAPRLPAVVYRLIAEPSVRFQSYLRGDVDVCDVPLGRLGQVRQWPDHRSWPELITFYLGISFTREPCRGNLHLRRALNWAVDRRRLCGVILEGRGVPAKGVLPPGMPGYDPDLEGYRFDPAAARRELELAGFPEGRGLAPIQLYFRSEEDSRLMAVELQQQFRRAGIPVELVPTDWGYLRSMTRRSPPPLFRMSWVADYADPENFLFDCFHSSARGQSNRAHYASAEADRLLEAAAALPHGPARLAAFARAERRIVADAPWVFLYHRTAHLLVRPEVRGLTFTPLDAGQELPQADFAAVWKDD